MKFEQLSDEAKKKARDWWRSLDDGVDYDFIIDDAKECGNILGMDIVQIYFSGFSSQGDGAQFEGDYRYGRGSRQNIRKHAPHDQELHRLADELFTLQKPYYFTLTATSKHRGHYYHEMCTDISVYAPDNVSQERYTVAEDRLCELLRDFMRWIYKQLENHYDYCMSDDAIDETIIANEYEFDEEGDRADP